MCDEINREIEKLPDRLQDKLREVDADFDASMDGFSMQLTLVRRTFFAVQEKYKNLPSPRGRSRNMALRIWIKKLREIFSEHYRGSREAPENRGAFKHASPMEIAEKEFICVALKDAGIILPQDIHPYMR